MTPQSPLIEVDGLKAQHILRANNPLSSIYRKVLERQRITREDAIAVYESNDLLSVGILADTARRLITPPDLQDHVYWVHNFHINPTNICEANCRFCSFKKGPKSPFAYVMSIDDVIENVNQYDQKDRLSEFHIVSGLYREQSLEYYVDLFNALTREFPHVHIKGMTAVEMKFMADVEGIPVGDVLKALKDAGLRSMPGGGAEVFSERMREIVCVDKISGDEWLDVHGQAHAMGLSSTATLLAGIGETYQERIDHMIRLREQQDKSGGFMTFIPLNCYYEGNAIDPSNALTGIENLKNFAVSRLVLDNFPHIKAFWVHIGQKISQVGLNFGVDDLDGTVVHEKIANSAGTASGEHMTQDKLLNLIWKAGRIPVERDSLYGIKKEYPMPEDKRGYHEAHDFNAVTAG
jgi:aminodeoxyfutalosine synthase